MSTPSEQLFDEIIRLWKRREQEIICMLKDSAQLGQHCSSPDAVAEFLGSAYKNEINDMLTKIFNEQITLFCDSLMAAFDGATELSNKGLVLDIVVEGGLPICEYYQDEFTEYMMTRGHG